MVDTPSNSHRICSKTWLVGEWELARQDAYAFNDCLQKHGNIDSAALEPTCSNSYSNLLLWGSSQWDRNKLRLAVVTERNPDPLLNIREVGNVVHAELLETLPTNGQHDIQA